MFDVYINQLLQSYNMVVPPGDNIQTDFSHSAHQK